MDMTYSIKDVAEATELSIDTLRYYERIGLIVGIERAKNGHRRYCDRDITWILFLKQLRATGMSIADMKRFADLRKQGDVSTPQRRHMLEVHRQALLDQVAQIHDFIDVIDAKIARHKKFEEGQP